MNNNSIYHLLLKNNILSAYYLNCFNVELDNINLINELDKLDLQSLQ